MLSAFHAFWVDLRQAHAAAGDLGLLVTLVAGPRQHAANERFDQSQAIGSVSWERGGPGSMPAISQRFGKPLRAARAPTAASDRSRSARLQRRIPLAITQRCPSDGDASPESALLRATHGDVRHVEHRRAAVAAMCEEKSARRLCLRARSTAR